MATMRMQEKMAYGSGLIKDTAAVLDSIANASSYVHKCFSHMTFI